MIIAFQLYPKYKTYTFNSILEASRFTNVSCAHIKLCIKTGHKYRMWCFDEVD